MSKESALRWLKQALHDLEMGEKVLTIEGYDLAAFVAHQSVEKLLKAVIAFHDEIIPRTHNLDELAGKAGASKEVTDLIEEINADYLLARYPDMSEEVPFEQYDRELAEQKLNAAKQIFNLLKPHYLKFLEKQ